MSLYSQSHLTAPHLTAPSGDPFHRPPLRSQLFFVFFRLLSKPNEKFSCLPATAMSDPSDSDYDSDAYAECNDIDSEHSPDSDYDDPPPMAKKKQVHSPLETFSSSCKHGQDAEKNGMDNLNASALTGMVAPRAIKQSTQLNIQQIVSGETYNQENASVDEDDDDGVEEEEDEIRSLQLLATDEVKEKVPIPSLAKLEDVPKDVQRRSNPSPEKTKAVQPRRTVSIPAMAEHFRDDDVTRTNAEKPLRGKHGMLHPKPPRTVVQQPISCQTSMPPQTSTPPGLTEIVRTPQTSMPPQTTTPPGLTEIVRTPRSQASFAEAERVHDLQMTEEYALHNTARVPSPPRDPRLTAAQVLEASAAAAARWANGCSRMDGGYAAKSHQNHEVGFETFDAFGSTVRPQRFDNDERLRQLSVEASARPVGAKQKRTRWGPRHAPESCATPARKRTRWGPRHPVKTNLTVLEDIQMEQQKNQSFAVALADLDRAQAYQREELYKAFGIRMM